MKGWRTLLFNIAALVVPLLQTTGAADLGITGKWAAIYAAAVAVANIYLRTITTTPMGQSTPSGT